MTVEQTPTASPDWAIEHVTRVNSTFGPRAGSILTCPACKHVIHTSPTLPDLQLLAGLLSDHDCEGNR